MGDIVNLNDRRKQRDRASKAAAAASNRVIFGLGKSEKTLQEKQRSAEDRKLDGARREPETGPLTRD
ncbi:MAG: DUF4169 family protein [Alphaproteobacteria bacterium]|nr:DUF4169 family protein [Alphaproteobacteria bacterium]